MSIIFLMHTLVDNNRLAAGGATAAGVCSGAARDQTEAVILCVTHCNRGNNRTHKQSSVKDGRSCEVQRNKTP